MSLILGTDLGWDSRQKKWFILKENGPEFHLTLEELLTAIGKSLEKIRINQEFNFKYKEKELQSFYA